MTSQWVGLQVLSRMCVELDHGSYGACARTYVVKLRAFDPVAVVLRGSHSRTLGSRALIRACMWKLLMHAHAGGQLRPGSALIETRCSVSGPSGPCWLHSDHTRTWSQLQFCPTVHPLYNGGFLFERDSFVGPE